MPSRSSAPRRLLAAVVTTTALVALSACGGSPPEPATGKSELRFGGTVMTTFDPAKAPTYTQSFLTPVYESLLTRDASGELAPGLATEWALSVDGRTFDLTLRGGVTFQDGAPLTADAVRRTIERHKTLPGSLVAAQLSVVERVEAVDATHVRFHLSGPPGAIGNILASEAGMIISPNAVDSPDLDAHPVGTGAYTLTSRTDSEVVYTAWDGYWNKAAVNNSGIRYIQQQDTSARFRALASGEVDVIGMDGSYIDQAENAGMKVVQGDSTNMVGLLLNPVTVPELANPLVRQAVSRAINRQTIARNSGFSGACTPTVQPFPQGYWAHSDTLDNDPSLTYDVAAAKALLAQAGLPNGFSFRLDTIAPPAFSSLAQILQAQLAEAGITVEINVMDTSSYQAARAAGNIEVGAGQYPAGRPDPSVFMQQYYLPDGIFNYAKVEYPGTAQLFEQSLASTDTAERSAPAQKLIETVMRTGSTLVPICGLRQTFGTSPDVAGFGTTLLQEYDWRGIAPRRSA